MTTRATLNTSYSAIFRTDSPRWQVRPCSTPRSLAPAHMFGTDSALLRSGPFFTTPVLTPAPVPIFRTDSPRWQVRPFPARPFSDGSVTTAPTSVFTSDVFAKSPREFHTLQLEAKTNQVLDASGLESHASGSHFGGTQPIDDWRRSVEILSGATAFFADKPRVNAIRVAGKINVVGDLHGCMDSLNGSDIRRPSNPEQYLVFNGDFVDRGPHSLEILETVCLLMLQNPGCVFLNRGNHECETISTNYGHRQSLDKFGPYKDNVWQACLKLYSSLPVASLVRFPSGMQIFVVHGGICENLSISDICKAPRGERSEGYPVEPLLWNSPIDNEKGLTSPRAISPKGARAVWRPEATYRFLAENQVSYIVRSHDVVDNGFSACHDDRVLTIFSASVQCPNPAFLQITDQQNYLYSFKRSWKVMPIHL